ncbi:MAG: hypothetical protein JOZ94_24990 [Xanthobacteraceae bacterium]|nr:hypothetical protein [Xanthobacteraceae bacterium]MBV9632397.1 hypothetical protein [Xanthobacteraceae bacterium]
MKGIALSIAAMCLTCALPATTLAQAPVQDRFPADDSGPAAKPATPGPAPAKPTPAAKAAPAAKPAEHEAAEKPKHAVGTPAPAHTVACNGAFTKDSSHMKLATAFGSQNVTWDDVDGPGGSKLKASVLFPKDPKRRLEVLWAKPDARSDLQLVAINHQSSWSAPKGLHLGMTLAAVEKLNGKPFELSGFTKDTGGSVQSWDGGALAELPGGCKVSLRFEPDAKAAPDVRSDVAVERQFSSSDPPMKKAAPKVVEILIGY